MIYICNLIFNLFTFQVSYIQDLPPIPKFDTPPPLLLTQNDNPSDVTDNTKNEMHHVKEKLLSVLNKGIDPADAKVCFTFNYYSFVYLLAKE